jgi:hypothetical protein
LPLLAALLVSSCNIAKSYPFEKSIDFDFYLPCLRAWIPVDNLTENRALLASEAAAFPLPVDCQISKIEIVWKSEVVSATFAKRYVKVRLVIIDSMVPYVSDTRTSGWV